MVAIESLCKGISTLSFFNIAVCISILEQDREAGNIEELNKQFGKKLEDVISGSLILKNGKT